MDAPKLHIAIISISGMGHLIPATVLAHRLSTSHNAKVTLLVFPITSSPPPGAAELIKFGNRIEILEIPRADISHLINPDTKFVTQLFLMVREASPSFKYAIEAMNHRPDALIFDFLCTEAFCNRPEFDMPRYAFVPSSAWFTALTMYCPVLDKEIEGQYVDQTEPVKIPGCQPFRPEDLVEPMLDRNDQLYHEYVRLGIELGLCDGILVNSWEELEPESVRAVRENEFLRSVVKVPVYSIGPLTRSAEPGSPKSSHIIEWLDVQPTESVTYVSFGSGGALSAREMIELAHGLELSRQRFVWVVRPPMDYAHADESYDASDYLPEGFRMRTREAGLVVVSEWVQQVEILNHPAVGGFVSHCGWNSILESINSGVPMIAWPLYAEQRLNATFLIEELGVAIRLDKQVINRAEIEKAIRIIMVEIQGKTMRAKIKQLKACVQSAPSKDRSSYKSICRALCEIEMKRRF